VHIPSTLSRERKAMCNMREAQIEARTKLVNTARSWLRTQGIGVLRGGGQETFPGGSVATWRAEEGQCPKRSTASCKRSKP